MGDVSATPLLLRSIREASAAASSRVGLCNNDDGPQRFGDNSTAARYDRSYIEEASEPGPIFSEFEEMTISGGQSFPRSLLQAIKSQMGWLQREELRCILLSAQRSYITDYRLEVGSQSAVNARYRRLIEPMIRFGASAFILLHNHPSGDPRPSESDRRTTQYVGRLCHALELTLDDHFIIAGHQAYSMREAALIT